MKKFVAIVLALALALSLCTVAMAATKVTSLDGETEYLYYPEVKGSCTVAGHPAYYTDGTNYYKVVTKAGADTTTLTVAGTPIVKAVTETADIDALTDGVYEHDLSCLTVSQKPTCTADGYKAGVYKCATCGKYFNAVDSYENADGYNTYGLTKLKINEINTYAEKYDATTGACLSAGHALYALPYTYDAKGQQEYKCAVCGAVVAGCDNFATMKSLYDVDAIEEYDTDTYVATNYIAENPTFAANHEMAGVDGLYYVVVTAGTTAATTTTTTTVDSSKTFDAGVAMYVGLSLMSVAGSAVVIGKKKEF